MSRRGDNIRKRKDGRWEGRYIFMRDLTGKGLYRSVYGKTYSDVKKKLGQVNVSNPQKKAYTTITVNDVSIEWLNSIKQNRKYSTYVKYESIYIKHIKQSIGNRRIFNITEEECAYFINLKQSCNSSNSTRLSNSVLNSIKNVLTQIIIYGTGNHSFKIRNKCNISNFSQKTEKIHIFTKKEQEVLYNYLVVDIDNYKLGILICLFAGLRLGEVCALKTENIDLSNRTIEISQTVQRVKSTSTNAKTELMITSPKTTNSKRLIPICNTLYSLFNNYLTEMTYVINEETVMDPRTYQYYFKKILNKLSIEDRNFHCIRHTFATNCISSGMDIKCLSEILGHSDVKTTLNRYVHPTMEQKLSQINFLSHDYGQQSGHVN